MKVPYKLSCEGQLLILEWGERAVMSKHLEAISNFIEDKTSQTRLGHNFPLAKARVYLKTRQLSTEEKDIKALLEKHPTCSYLIAHLKNDVGTKMHELRHAKFFLEQDYRDLVYRMWEGLDELQQTKILTFLKSLGYSDEVLIDEFQAYYFTEKRNFFGFHLEGLES